MKPPIVVAALADAQRRANNTDADLPLPQDLPRRLFASRRPYHFFAMTSRAISALLRFKGMIIESTSP